MKQYNAWKAAILLIAMLLSYPSFAATQATVSQREQTISGKPQEANKQQLSLDHVQQQPFDAKAMKGAATNLYKNQKRSSQDLTEIVSQYIPLHTPTDAIVEALREEGFEIVAGEERGFVPEQKGFDDITLALFEFYPNIWSRILFFHSSIRVVLYSNRGRVEKVKAQGFYHAL